MKLQWRTIYKWQFDPYDGWYGPNPFTCLCYWDDDANEWKEVEYESATKEELEERRNAVNSKKPKLKR